MKLRFSPEARRDWREVTRYYQHASPDTANRFRAAFGAAIRYVTSYPLGSPVRGHGLRRKVISAFPYNILYSVIGDTIRVVAIAHQSRNPDTMP